MKKNVFLLAVCVALFMSSTSMLVSTATLVGLRLANDATAASMPLGALFLAMMIFTYPFSMLMKRYGRRAGFYLGLSSAVCGGLLACWSILNELFVPFCFGVGLMGVYSAAATYYRFAAADIADDQFRPIAISLVMAGGVAAAFTGPNLARITKDIMDAGEFAGSYLAILVIYLISAVILWFVSVPRPSGKELASKGRPLPAIIAEPTFVVAAGGAMVAYGVMNLIMTATPLAIHYNNMPFADTATVIQWHIVGMFAPSFITGWLVRKFGVLRIMACGAVFLGCSVSVNLSGQTFGHFLAALVMLGMGWNFLYLGGTNLITETCLPADKAKSQGFNDLLVSATVAITAFTSGVLHETVGWESMNSFTLPFIVAAALGVLWLTAKLKTAYVLSRVA